MRRTLAAIGLLGVLALAGRTAQAQIAIPTLTPGGGGSGGGTPGITMPPNTQSVGDLNDRAPGNRVSAELDRHGQTNAILLNNMGPHTAWSGQSAAPSLQEQLAPGYVGPPGTNGLYDPVLPTDDFGEALLKTVFQSFLSVFTNLDGLLNFVNFEDFFYNLLAPQNTTPDQATGVDTTSSGDFRSAIP